MLINLKPDELRDDFNMRSYFLSCLGAALLAAVLVLFLQRGVTPEMEKQFAMELTARAEGSVFGSIESIAYPLFQKQMVPFELASALIVVATFGAVLLSKKRV
jgi:NADH:ubiquinone oxidoreductase subunit 6 (subunit J)